MCIAFCSSTRCPLMHCDSICDPRCSPGHAHAPCYAANSRRRGDQGHTKTCVTPSRLCTALPIRARECTLSMLMRTHVYLRARAGTPTCKCDICCGLEHDSVTSGCCTNKAAGNSCRRRGASLVGCELVVAHSNA
jgi:hypothetical protein